MKGRRKQRQATRDAIHFELAKRDHLKRGDYGVFFVIHKAVREKGWKTVYREKFAPLNPQRETKAHIEGMLRQMEREEPKAEVVV